VQSIALSGIIRNQLQWLSLSCAINCTERNNPQSIAMAELELRNQLQWLSLSYAINCTERNNPQSIAMAELELRNQLH
jgi:hypothetical protein